MNPPRLVESIGIDNIVEWAGRFWRVPQKLGSLDIARPADRAKAGITEHASLEEARGAGPRVPPRPAAPAGPKRVIATSWWDRTGRYTEFVDGISSPIFRRLGGTEDVSSRDMPDGALYVIAREPGDKWPPVGADGLSIACVLPGRTHWYIDGRASNCTMPADHAHRCWVRHGSVGDRITVDKAGATCQAGGGSIDVPGFHAMLTAGELREC